MTLQPTKSPTEADDVTIVVPSQIVDGIIQISTGDVTVEVIREKALGFLELGFKAAQTASLSLNTAAVEEAFENGTGTITSAMEEKSQTMMEGFVETQNALAAVLDSKICADDSEMALQLTGAYDLLVGLIAGMSDPHTEGSLAHNVSMVATSNVEKVMHQIDAAFDLSDPESMASKQLKTLKAEFAPVLADSVELKTAAIAELAKIATASGYQEMVNTHPGKGGIFEDEVGPKLQAIAERHGDVTEDMGTETDGTSSSKKGDHLSRVYLASKEISRIVFEDKAGSDWSMKGTGPKSIQAELQESMAVNKADVGIAVVDFDFSPKELKKNGILNPQPGMYVVAVKRTTGDFTMLAFLYRIIRLELVSSYLHEKADETGIDPAVVIAVCKAAANELTTVSKVMKNLKQASNNSLAQRKALKDMKDNLSEMLSDMESALSDGGAS